MYWDEIKGKNKINAKIEERDENDVPFFLDFGDKLGQKPKTLKENPGSGTF